MPIRKFLGLPSLAAISAAVALPPAMGSGTSVSPPLPLGFPLLPVPAGLPPALVGLPPAPVLPPAALAAWGSVLSLPQPQSMLVTSSPHAALAGYDSRPSIM